MGPLSREQLLRPAVLISAGFSFALAYAVGSMAAFGGGPAWLAMLVLRLPAGPLVLAAVCAAGGASLGVPLDRLLGALNPQGRREVLRRGAVVSGFSAIPVLGLFLFRSGFFLSGRGSELLWLSFGLVVVAFFVALWGELPFGALSSEFDGAGEVPGFFRGALAEVDPGRRAEIEALERGRPPERWATSGLLRRTGWAICSFGLVRLGRGAVAIYPWGAMGTAVRHRAGVARATYLDADGYHHGLTDLEIAARERRDPRGVVVHRSVGSGTTTHTTYARVPGGVEVIPRSAGMAVPFRAALGEAIRAGVATPWEGGS